MNWREYDHDTGSNQWPKLKLKSLFIKKMSWDCPQHTQIMTIDLPSNIKLRYKLVYDRAYLAQLVL